MQLLSACRDVSKDTDSTDAQRDNVLSHYLQRVVDGESQSAVFVAARGEAVLLGVTRQLIGASWTGATGFRYGGSIGPLQPSAAHRSQWWTIGDGLASGFDLRGLFGVDAIVNDRGIWAIEVNPRYTSSIEVLEFGLEFHAVTDHVAACRDGQLKDLSPAAHGRFHGKAIIYAGRDVRIDDAFVRAARQANAEQTWPVVADIPTAAQTIAAGHPVATVFASSDRLTDVEPRLRDAVQAWRTKWKL
jgi:predicted ATP-grasp superfamily ATP-dependent carboligase